MKLKILAFGVAQDVVGGKSIHVSVPGSSINAASLKTFLIQKYPGLSQVANFLIAVNGQYVYDQKQAIKASDELAIIPPTSGG